MKKFWLTIMLMMTLAGAAYGEDATQVEVEAGEAANVVHTAPVDTPTNLVIHSFEYQGMVYNVVELKKIGHDVTTFDGNGNKIKKQKDHWWNIRGREYKIYKKYSDGQITLYTKELSKTAKKQLTGVKDNRPYEEKHPFLSKGGKISEDVNRLLGPAATFVLSLGGVL